MQYKLASGKLCLGAGGISQVTYQSVLSATLSYIRADNTSVRRVSQLYTISSRFTDETGLYTYAPKHNGPSASRTTHICRPYAIEAVTSGHEEYFVGFRRTGSERQLSSRFVLLYC